MFSAAELDAAHLDFPDLQSITLEKYVGNAVSTTVSVANSRKPDLTPDLIEANFFSDVQINTNSFAVQFHSAELAGYVPQPNDRVELTSGLRGRIVSVNTTFLGRRHVCLCQKEIGS